MKRYKAKSLEDACSLASIELGCLVEDLVYRVVEYPVSGVLGMFSKKAIIEVDTKFLEKDISKSEDEIMQDRLEDGVGDNSTSEKPIELDRDKVIDSFYNSSTVDYFYPDTDSTVDMASEISKGLKDLFESSCFDIDTLEVDVKDGVAYIFIDGEDAALLIGKIGYRYNAIYYMISNWLQSKYRLYTKLEIARFITEQKEMISVMMESVIKHVEDKGWAKTRPLDGVLVELALEQLRSRFPDKYVAIKKREDGRRYILINKFNQK